ncbi:MAG TPA: histidine kinase [Actinomycetales bacterium]|nr:histidine kinase [Actinomycetales bacterium]
MLDTTTPQGCTGGTAAARSDRPALPPWGLALVVTVLGVLLLFTAWGTHASGDFRVALDVPAGVLALALVPLMIRRPVVVAVLLALVAVVSPLAAPVGPTAVLQAAQRRRFPVALAVGALDATGHVARYAWRPLHGMSFLWWCVLMVATHAALVGWGAWWQARTDLVRSLTDRAERAETEQGRRVAEARAFERRQMAAEMHDVLAHRLSLLATYAGALEYRPDAPPELLARAAGVVRDGVHEALDELREVIAVLRDDTPADAGGRPQPRLADVHDLVRQSRDAGVDVTLAVSSWGNEPPGPVARAAYRVVQEGLTNARRHAPGAPVQVTLARDGDRLLVVVRCPLVAAPPTSLGSGTGLIGLTERVQLAGGTLDHGARHGVFTVRASLPWRA